ncbi:MAG: ribosome silencing factor [Candidatus Marinimicrobia bacterium]|nr:ribosome silencing factor [Candidatus Neomarinimicrobiota bacterium]
MAAAVKAGFDSVRLAERAADLMLDKHADDVIIMDLRELTSMTDYFVMGTATSDIQVKAIIDHVDDSLRSEGEKPYHIEGSDELSWVIIDYVNVVAHVFAPEARQYYGLERLWADAKITQVTDSA